MSRPRKPRRIVHSFDGASVDTSGRTWTVAPGTSLDFEEFHVPAARRGDDPVLDSFADYVRHLIAKKRPRTVLVRFYVIRKMLRVPEVRAALKATDSSLVLALTSATRKLMSATRYGYIATIRAWYVFASSDNHPGFDPDVATLLEVIRFRRGRVGVAVLRSDPGQGPLTPKESERLESALWKAADDGTLKTKVVLAGLLFYTFGFNPEHLRRLHERDLAIPTGAKAPRELRVPRVKKKGSADRASFFKVDLSPRLGALWDRQVEENKGRSPASPEVDRPLFRPRKVDAKDDDYVYVNFFNFACDTIKSVLKVEADDGSTLHIFPRRLRYSFTSRAIANGATIDELTAMLDHGNPRTMMQYFAARLDIVPKLDAALGPDLERVAAIAMNRRVPLLPAKAPPLLETVPFACVACPEFRPVERRVLELLPDRAGEDRPDAFTRDCERAAQAFEPAA